MVKQLGFIIDLNKCIGCKGCEMACHNENCLDDIHYRKIVTLAEHPKNFFGFLSMACNHCRNPACIKVCPKGCFKKRKDGIVLHTNSNCSGCESCIGACPFRVPQINPQTGKVEKCNFCFKRIDQGLKPACVEACIPEALYITDLSKPLSEKYHEILPGFTIIRITRPSIRFILPQPPVCFWRHDK
ncbi:MAG: 4Fe-4S ferredoxin, iron-sulpur binding protein [Clostridiales bacterium]|jgi:Fe-S-cluster-containing dehydrogenase component|nr:4Fe-4S ferredoxin, iron-sulpur binding protein [Clostridiales bacterium]